MSFLIRSGKAEHCTATKCGVGVKNRLSFSWVKLEPDGRACSSSYANVGPAAPDQATHAVGGAFHSKNNALSAAPPAYGCALPASVDFNSLPEDLPRKAPTDIDINRRLEIRRRFDSLIYALPTHPKLPSGGS